MKIRHIFKLKNIYYKKISKMKKTHERGTIFHPKSVQSVDRPSSLRRWFSQDASLLHIVENGPVSFCRTPR